MEIRNLAIIAHVDHGKTTLVDEMLKQTKTFRTNQKEMGEHLIMDSNELEREKGITILAKNTAIAYKGTKINIIDTPGHADFGGEVERVLNMASGALLLVDAAEGPLPQTKFVLKKAIAQNLKLIVVINKIDRDDSQAQKVLSDVENLFLELAAHDDQLHFPIIYAVGRDGKAYTQLPEKYDPKVEDSLEPLFETILKTVPDSVEKLDEPFQLMISTLDYDNYVGKLCIGKVSRGRLKKGENVALVSEQKVLGTHKVQKLYTYEGLNRIEVEEVSSGDIIAIAGIPQMTIGQTATNPNKPESLPTISVEEPTIKITIGPNTSPLSGREGNLFTSRQIGERLMKEKETNLGLAIEENPGGGTFIVAGRGELHLSVLIETMRREGFELEISKPQVIYKEINGVMSEPFEEVTIDVDEAYVGVITEEFAKRKAELASMHPERNNTMRFIYRISSQNLLGVRNSLLTKTRGTAIIHTYLLGYMPKVEKMQSMRNGVLIATNTGKTLTYGLENAQERGTLFVGPGEEVYEGMIVGVANANLNVEINVCKGKKLTNVRSNADIDIPLTPPVKLSLEQSLDFLADDELLEVTPLSLRLRKRYLSEAARRNAERQV